jgi:hypothetical protein
MTTQFTISNQYIEKAPEVISEQLIDTGAINRGDIKLSGVTPDTLTFTASETITTLARRVLSEAGVAVE